MHNDKETAKIIIAIDDEPQNLELVEVYMRNTGYAVRTFSSGIPALEYMDSTADDIALVIVDIMMPEISGYEVCSAIRSRPKYKFLPILVSSGLSSSPDKVKAMESGADDFVTKPLDRQTLMIRVKSLVRIGDLYNDLIFKNRQLEAAVEKLKIAQDTIIQNEKYISIVAMAQGMAHEIYNPLTIINGNVERMLIKIKNQDIAGGFLTEMAASIKAASSRCVKIIESLQIYSSENMNMVEKTNINEILRKVITIFESEYLIKHNITFGEDLDDKIPAVNCDIQSLTQAFINIIMNSQEAMADGGRIGVTTKFDNDNIIITISDSGRGFSEEMLRKAFDPFYTTKNKPMENSGLGLPMALGIIKLHKGDITIKNNSDGRGAMIRIAIPKDVKLDNNLYNVIF